MSASTPEGVPITVTGGAGGVAASYSDLGALGDLYRCLAGDLAGAAWHDRGAASDPDLVLSAALAPDTFATAEAAIVAAAHGPRGLVGRAVLVEAQGLAIGAVVDLYRAADGLQHLAYEHLSYGLGVVVGRELVPVVAVLGAAATGVHALDPALTGDLEDDLVELVEAHPGAVQTLVNGSGGLLDGLATHPAAGLTLAGLGVGGLHLTTGSAAADLGDLLFTDRVGLAVREQDAPSFDPPTGIADLVGDLGVTADGGDGAITVQRLGEGASSRWVVHLPGTDSFVDDDVVRGPGSNLDLVAGDRTAYADAVADALDQAGADEHQPVLLVGHSQGGMQAAALAADPGLRHHVTHVVTAGAPVATIAVPVTVSVLSLENSADVVPSLDGEPNPDRPHRTTVLADVRTGSLGAGGGDHGIALYAEMARTADASADPSVRTFVEQLRETGFLDPTANSTTSLFSCRLGHER